VSGVRDPGGEMGTLTIVAEASQVTRIWAALIGVRIPPLWNNPSGTHNQAAAQVTVSRGG